VSRPHVVFFNRSFHPDTTATGQLLGELAEALVRDHGWRVTVVAGAALAPAAAGGPRRPRGLVSREQYRGVDVLRVRGTRFSKRRFAGRFSNYLTYFLLACWAGLRVDRPDVLVALTDPPIIGLAAYAASRRFDVPFVMAFKDIFPEVARLLEDFHSATVERALQVVTCFLARRADRVAVLGETMRRKLVGEKGADPAKTVVIPDWTDCAEIAPGPRRNAFAEAHGLGEKFVVMHSGNIGLSQALDGLVDAAAHLQRFPEIEVVFVGEGVKKPALQEQARRRGLRNVRFLPYTPKEQLGESFASADVFVVSLKPGLAGYIVPSKLYGILAAGRPYVAAVEEDSEVVAITRKYDAGLVVRPGDPAALAEGLLQLYRDPVLRERLGENARRAALEFDRPVQMRAYDQMLRGVVASRRAMAGSRPSRLKRVVDVALAAAGLVVSAPLWVVIALAIKVEDRGPVFYSQDRVGLAGRRFRSLKFRSMVPDADRRFGPRQAGERDRRITRVGRVLRATAMDELPQLWNIFRGDMSFVGPRALMPAEIEVRGGGRSVRIEEVPGYDARHRVRPGLTGLAQIFADRDIPRRHKFRLDQLYIRRQSFWLDLKLILLSFWISFRGKWERRGRKL